MLLYRSPAMLPMSLWRLAASLQCSEARTRTVLRSQDAHFVAGTLLVLQTSRALPSRRDQRRRN